MAARDHPGRDPLDAEFPWHEQGMHGNNVARATCMLDELQFRRVRENRFGNEWVPEIDEPSTGGSGDLLRLVRMRLRVLRPALPRNDISVDEHRRRQDWSQDQSDKRRFACTIGSYDEIKTAHGTLMFSADTDPSG